MKESLRLIPEVKNPLYEEHMLAQFNRYTALDFAITATIATATEMEMPVPEEWANIMHFARYTVRRAVFASLMDIYDNGSMFTKMYAVNRIRDLKEGSENQSRRLAEEARDKLPEMAFFVSDQQGISYENTYLR